MCRGIRTLTLVVVFAACLWLASIPGTAQTDSGTEISSCTEITDSGTYVLTEDITTEGDGVCIDIVADEVELDGNGHELQGSGVPESEGIRVAGDGVTVRDVVVTNFAEGVRFADVADGTATDVTARLNENGINYRRGSGGEITDSLAYENGNTGISSFGSEELLVRGNNASHNFGDGIWINSGWTVVDNVAVGNEEDGILVRNIDRDETTLVRNNTADRLGMFIARTGTIEDNTVVDMRVSEAFNVTVRDNDIEDGLSIYRVNESTFSGNTVGELLRIEGGFRGMSGTDRRTVCSRNLLVEDTEILQPSREAVVMDENASGAEIRNLTIRSTSLSMLASQNVTVGLTTDDRSSPAGAALSTALQVTPRRDVGQATVAVDYDTDALADDEVPLFWRSGGEEWSASESYLADSTVGTSVVVEEAIALRPFGTSQEEADQFRVDEPTDVDVECRPQGSSVVVVRENGSNTSEGTAPGDDWLPLTLLAGGAVSLFVVGLLVAGLRRRSSDEGTTDGPAHSGNKATDAGTASASGANVPSGEGTTDDADADTDVETTPAAGPTGVDRTESGQTPVLVVESDAFEPVTAHVRVRTSSETVFEASLDLPGGERREVWELPTDEAFEVAAVVEDGPTDAVVFDPEHSPISVRVRLDAAHLEISRVVP